MNNPQAHSAHYFCHLNEYSAHKVQESRGITLRSYKNTNGSQSTYVVKSAKGSGSQTRGGGSQIRGGGRRSREIRSPQFNPWIQPGVVHV